MKNIKYNNLINVDKIYMYLNENNIKCNYWAILKQKDKKYPLDIVNNLLYERFIKYIKLIDKKVFLLGVVEDLNLKNEIFYANTILSTTINKNELKSIWGKIL